MPTGNCLELAARRSLSKHLARQTAVIQWQDPLEGLNYSLDCAWPLKRMASEPAHLLYRLTRQCHDVHDFKKIATCPADTSAGPSSVQCHYDHTQDLKTAHTFVQAKGWTLIINQAVAASSCLVCAPFPLALLLLCGCGCSAVGCCCFSHAATMSAEMLSSGSQLSG